MINIFGNGSIVCLATESTELQPIKITNTGGQILTNIVVTVTIPTGLVYNSHTASTGTFTSPIWEIPSLGVGNSATLDICFEVTDDTEGPWEITYVAIHDDSQDAVPTDDAAERNIDGFACSEFENCPNIPTVEGDHTITGNWEFDLNLVVPDDPYDATDWNGNFEVPTKNAVRDKFESLVAGTVPDGDYTDITVSGGGTVWTIDPGLNAANIADGSVSNTEFQYLSTVTSNVQDQLNNKADDVDVVHNTGNESIGGTKTFTSDVSVPDEVYGAPWNGSLEVPTKNAVYDKIETLAIDASVVHLAGSENITGVKTFTVDPIIPDEAYGVGWNGSLEPPTKNAVYDKIEALASDIPTLQEVLDAGSTLTSSETIATGANTLTISTATAATNPLHVTSTTGDAIYVQATTGEAIDASNTGSNAVIRGAKVSASNNTVQALLSLGAQTSGTAANGIGGAIDIYVEADGGGNPSALRLKAVTTDVATATFTTKGVLSLSNLNALTDVLEIAGNGKVTLPEYGSGTFTGTAVYNLQVDSSGNIIESAAATTPLVYKALWTQTGTGAPTATIMVNTLGEVPTLARSIEGTYTATIVGSLFTSAKTFLQVSSANTSTPIARFFRTSDTVVTLTTHDLSDVLDELEGTIYISIEVYP